MKKRYGGRLDVKNRLGKPLRIGSLILLVTVLALALSSSALSNSPPQQPPPPSEISLGAVDDGRQIELGEGQVLVVSLEGNPSTGYIWQVEEEAARILRQTGEIEFEPESNLLGTPGTQTLRFKAVEAGQTTLKLVYRRPWEEVEPARTFSVQVRGVGTFPPAESPTLTPTSETLTETTVLADVQSQLGLPSAFNWCDWGGCTTVRNQGSCGSCWAFSTVGPLESNIRIHDGFLKDLSEQYLVSCNTDGWGCDGGWFAHDYHWWKYGYNEPGPGAVYETDFGYQAWEVPCGLGHTHHEQVDSWAYVADSGSVPSVAAIKQAIYDYGPVSAAVCAGPSWPGYLGGVFETDETQWCNEYYLGQDVNHAIVLVGWDDNQGTNGVWYVRNSWGPYWGESGYMRVKYGVSSVGYAAGYIVYASSEECHRLSTTVSPTGSGTITSDPTANCGNRYHPQPDVQLAATPEAGWHFTGWSGDASGSSDTTTITMDSDKSVSAHFMCDGCVPQAFLPLVMKDY